MFWSLALAEICVCHDFRQPLKHASHLQPRGPHYSSILDVCVPENEVPTAIHDFSDMSDLYSQKHPTSHTYSRRTVASQHVANIIREYAASALSYLCDTVAVLNHAEVDRAISDLEQLFAAMMMQPERATLCSLYECSIQEVICALQLPEVAPVPESLRDDEGETLSYAIAYLKAHMAVLRHARQHKLFVLHGQSHHLDGTDA